MTLLNSKEHGLAPQHVSRSPERFAHPRRDPDGCDGLPSELEKMGNLAGKDTKKIQFYPIHKPSGADWLGNVPAHWAVKAIKWESPVLRGASPRPIDDPIYFNDEGKYAWVRISDVTDAGTYLESTEQSLSDIGSALSVKLEPGNLFLSIAGSVGKPCITRIKCCIHDGFVYFPHWKADPKFLYYIFASGEPYKGLGKMGTQLNLNTDTVGSIIIGLPTEEEQYAIICFLDAKSAQIDTLIAKKRQLIDKLKEKRSALITRTVTRGLPPEAAKAAGLEPNPEMKNARIEWLGQMPQYWDLASLRWLSRRYTGGTPDKGNDTYWEDGEIPWINSGAVNDGYITEPSELITREGFANSSAKWIPKGALVMALAGQGKTKDMVAQLGIEATCNQSMAAIIPERRLEPRYLYFWLTANYQIIRNLAGGEARDGLNLDILGSILCPIPPLSEQQVIIRFLDGEVAKIDCLLIKIEEAISQLTEYRQALITAAVTGKIDVRGLAKQEKDTA